MKKFEEYGTVEGALPCWEILNKTADGIKRVSESGSPSLNQYYVTEEKDGIPTKGMYVSWSNRPYSCVLKSHDGSSRYFDVSDRKEMSDDEFRKTLADLGCDMKAYDSVVDNSKDNTDFEFSVEKDKARVWIMFNGEGITLNLARNPKEPGVFWTSEKFLKSIEIRGSRNFEASSFEASSEESLLDAIDSAVASEREKVVALGIKKISNGYLLNDTYFKTLGEAMEEADAKKGGQIK